VKTLEPLEAPLPRVRARRSKREKWKAEAHEEGFVRAIEQVKISTYDGATTKDDVHEIVLCIKSTCVHPRGGKTASYSYASFTCSVVEHDDAQRIFVYAQMRRHIKFGTAGSNCLRVWPNCFLGLFLIL
jgi:hypothetical protein